MADGGEEAVLGDVVVEDGVDFGLAGLRQGLDGGEGFDGETLKFGEPFAGESIGFAGVLRGLLGGGNAGRLGRHFGAGGGDIVGDLIEHFCFFEAGQFEFGFFFPRGGAVAEAEAFESPVDQ